MAFAYSSSRWIGATFIVSDVNFQDRLMGYMYYASVQDYAEALKGPLSVRAYGDKRPAHWPEALYGPSIPAWLGDFLS